jgi:hypothetical protein
MRGFPTTDLDFWCAYALDLTNEFVVPVLFLPSLPSFFDFYYFGTFFGKDGFIALN